MSYSKVGYFKDEVEENNYINITMDISMVKLVRIADESIHEEIRGDNTIILDINKPSGYSNMMAKCYTITRNETYSYDDQIVEVMKTRWYKDWSYCKDESNINNITTEIENVIIGKFYPDTNVRITNLPPTVNKIILCRDIRLYETDNQKQALIEDLQRIIKFPYGCEIIIYDYYTYGKYKGLLNTKEFYAKYKLFN